MKKIKIGLIIGLLSVSAFSQDKRLNCDSTCLGPNTMLGLIPKQQVIYGNNNNTVIPTPPAPTPAPTPKQCLSGTVQSYYYNTTIPAYNGSNPICCPNYTVQNYFADTTINIGSCTPIQTN